MLEWGAYDLVVISDSNVAVPRDWLARMVSEMEADPGVGLLANLFVGRGEGGALREDQLAAFHALADRLGAVT